MGTWQALGVHDELVDKLYARTALLLRADSLYDPTRPDGDKIIILEEYVQLANSMPEVLIERILQAGEVPITPKDATDIYVRYPSQDAYLSSVLGVDAISGLANEEAKKALRAVLLAFCEALHEVRPEVAYVNLNDQLFRRCGKWYIVHFCMRLNVKSEYIDKFDYKQNMSLPPIIVEMALTILMNVK